MSTQENQRLNSIAADSWYCLGANEQTIHYSYKIFDRFLRGGSILEMGPAEGVMTPYLADVADKLSLVEGAEQFCIDLRHRFPSASVTQSLFEDFETAERFDAIVLGHVLEHVADPVEILQRARGWLAPGGRILAVVPNCRSIHRQAAVLMGLLKSENEFNEMDVHHGHRRVYSPESFRNDFRLAGLKVDVFGGYWLKPLSNKQIEQTWTPEMLDAFLKLGERYPDIAGEIYVIASRDERD